MRIQRYRIGRKRLDSSELVATICLLASDDGDAVLYSDHIEREKVLKEALEANAWRRIKDGSLCWCGREVHTRYCSMARAALRTVEE